VIVTKVIEFRCRNCGYEVRIRIPNGYNAVRTTCPNCGSELVIRIREVGGGEVRDST